MAIKADFTLANGAEGNQAVILVNQYRISGTQTFDLTYVRTELDEQTREIKDVNEYRKKENQTRKGSFTATWFKDENYIAKGRLMGNFSFDDTDAKQLVIDFDVDKDPLEQCYLAIEALDFVTNVERIDVSQHGVK
jgi:hypothetical protein